MSATGTASEQAAQLSRAWWLFPLVTTVHNVEEAVWLPAWSRAGPFHTGVGDGEFRFAIVVLTCAAWFLTAVALRGRNGSLRLALCAYQGVMVFNVFFPHMAASVWAATLAPGTLTAVLLELPVGVFLLVGAVRDGVIAPRRLCIAVGAALLATYPALKGLFALGHVVVAIWPVR